MKINLRLFAILVVLAFTVMACQIGRSTAGISGETGEILFQDNFHDNSGGWYTYVDANGITDYENEGFRIYINEANAYYWTNPNLSFTDTIIEVEATKLSGPEENDFGIICRYQDENNFYFFTISSDGYYGIAKIVDGAEFLIGMDELGFDESAINPGDTTNLMRVDCTGKQLTLYANGNKLVEVQDSEFSSGDIGLVASTYDAPGTDILFDNLVVQKP